MEGMHQGAFLISIDERSILQEGVETFGSITITHYRIVTKIVLHGQHLLVANSKQSSLGCLCSR